MNDIFSLTTTPAETAGIKLKRVFHAYKDASFHMNSGNLQYAGELVFLRTMSGAGCIQIEGYDPQIVESESLIVFNRDKLTGFSCKKEPWEYWWFVITVDGGLPIPYHQVLNIRISNDEIHKMAYCLELLRKSDIHSITLASATISFLVYYWALEYQQQNNISLPYRDAVNRIISYLYENIGKNIPVKELAELSSLSERRFRDVFKNVTGKPLKKYCNDLRMEVATDLLSNTSLTISEIAYKLGYANPFYFSCCFKKHYGTSPSFYRVK